MQSCLACDLMDGTKYLPGGRIFSTDYWVVEHCVGPFGVGTLIVKPKRHCVHYWELTNNEVSEVGDLLRLTSEVIEQILHPDQIYICLWSHLDWKPAHIHFVVQPISSDLKDTYPNNGSFLQCDMVREKNFATNEQIVEFAEKAKKIFNKV